MSGAKKIIWSKITHTQIDKHRMFSLMHGSLDLVPGVPVEVKTLGRGHWSEQYLKVDGIAEHRQCKARGRELKQGCGGRGRGED